MTDETNFVYGKGLDATVNPSYLEEALKTIKSYHSKGQILVHCIGGVERSPLTAVMYLVQNRNMNIDDAYKLVMSKRSIVEDRRHWLK